MKKIVVSFILFFILIFCVTNSFGVNMFLESESDTDSIGLTATQEIGETEANEKAEYSEENVDEDAVLTIGALDSSEIEEQEDNQYVITSTTTTSKSNELTVTDIINVILISVGVVIILLSIAILIRMK